MNYLYFYHRDEYEWRFETMNKSPEKYNLKWPGLKTNPQTDKMLSIKERTPMPRVSTHWKYTRRIIPTFKTVKLDSPDFKLEVKEELKRGYKNITTKNN